MQTPRSTTYEHRTIQVGEYQVTGAVCPLCVFPTAIYPESLMEVHIQRHDRTIDQIEPAPTRYRRGRMPGTLNIHGMSSTGVEKKEAIRRQRKW